MMSWIGVRPRVFGGFALVLSFLVLLGGFAMVQVERIGGTVNELVTSAAGDAGMSQVRAALLSANGAVEKFIRTWNVGDREAATKAIANVGQLTDQIERQFGKLPTIAEGVGPVRIVAGNLPVFFRGCDGGRRPAARGDDKNRRPWRRRGA